MFWGLSRGKLLAAAEGKQWGEARDLKPSHLTWLPLGVPRPELARHTAEMTAAV